MHVCQGQSGSCRTGISTGVHVSDTPATTKFRADGLCATVATSRTSSAATVKCAHEPGAAPTTAGTSSAAAPSLISKGATPPFGHSREGTLAETVALPQREKENPPASGLLAGGFERLHACDCAAPPRSGNHDVHP